MAVMRYWNNNRANVPRTTVMYLSGQRGVQDVVRQLRLGKLAARTGRGVIRGACVGASMCGTAWSTKADVQACAGEHASPCHAACCPVIRVASDKTCAPTCCRAWRGKASCVNGTR